MNRPLSRALVLVDDSAAANIVVDHAIHIMKNLPGAEIVFFKVSPSPAMWEIRRGDDKRQRELSLQILKRFRNIAQYAGVRTKCRLERGEAAEVATKIACEESCDHIFLREPTSTFVGRTLEFLSGLRAGSIKHRIQRLSKLPVTAVPDPRG